MDWVDYGRRIQPGTDDELWIPPIANDEYLIISCNIEMLENRLQARLLVENETGIVFIPNQAFAHERLALVTNKRAWLRHPADLERRPFAWYITMTGRRLNRSARLRRHAAGCSIAVAWNRTYPNLSRAGY